MGSVIKCIVGYERPFWREKGFSGEVICDRGPVPAVFDDCSHDGKHAALLCFVLADAAFSLGRKPPEERRRDVEAALVGFFGPEAARSTGYVDKDWSADPWSGGCYFDGAVEAGERAAAEVAARLHEVTPEAR